MTDTASPPPPPRAAVISLHTSPQDQPGTGDSGGMNVYIVEVAKKLADQGIGVDIFTRCHGDDRPRVQPLWDRTRLITLQAGPCAPVAKTDLPSLLPTFLDGVLQFAAGEPDAGLHRHGPYDVVHSHYWLSGWVGARTKRIWGAPLVTSFHTLGKVKNYAAGSSSAEPPVRLDGEQRVVRHSDRILAPTPAEAAHLVALYGADPRRIRVVPPGVDRRVFSPAPKAEARARTGLPEAPVLLFVGRLQPLKGPDVAVRALGHAIARAPELTRDAVLAVVGGDGGAGPGRADEVGRLIRLAEALGVGDRVRFFPPQPHARLADFYSAADVVLVPSRSESFGLVALEAQACGTPVVAARVGGLRYVVAHGETGFLVQGHDAAAYAERVVSLLADPAAAARLGEAGSRRAARFSWDETATGIGEVYRDLASRRPGGEVGAA